MQNAADAAEPPSWTLVINGRLLGKASEAGEPGLSSPVCRLKPG